MKTKFEIEKTQYGEVELDIDSVSESSSIKQAIQEADEQGLVKWKDVSPMKIMNMSIDAYVAKCTEKGVKEPYNLIVLAENQQNAIALVEDYMAGITSDDYTIKLTKADKRDVAQYINDSDSFNFESVYEMEEKKQLSDYELEI